MANRTKTKRNQEILKRWDNGKGMTQLAIARMLHTSQKAVNAVIYRASKRSGDGEGGI